MAYLLSAIIALEGCSAMIALTQYAERTEHRPLDIGSTHADVDAKFGDPMSVEIYDDGSAIATYNETLTNYSQFWSGPPWERALSEVLSDIMLLGIPEIAWFPLELGGKIYRAVNTPDYRITVIYDTNDRVAAYSRAPVQPK